MDSTGRSNVGMQMDGDGNMSFPCSRGMANSTSDEALMISKASIAAHPFFSAGWDLLSQLDHRESLGSRIELFGSDHQPVGNQVMRGSISSLFPGQSVTDARLACFGSGNLSEAVIGSFSMPKFMGISDSRCLPSLSSCVNDGGGNGMNMGEGPITRGCLDSEDVVGANSPNNARTRKRSPDSRSSRGPNESNNTSTLQDVPNAQVEKKQKHKPDECPNSPQSKDNSRGEEAPKENRIHVRARRGQATNNHSLTERREKISETMKMLKELVPGCSKITGKAVMLDEIINYVQSLQQQVEFLSTKLATFIPDLSFDAGKPLLMDMNSHHAGATTMELSNPRLGSSPHFPPGMCKETLPIALSTAQCLSLSQLPFDGELHALYQMGFGSNSTDVLKPEDILNQNNEVLLTSQFFKKILVEERWAKEALTSKVIESSIQCP